MRLSPEEMNVLSERLEKEEARLRQGFSTRVTARREVRGELELISQLQQKLRDLKADLTLEEKQLVARLVQDEMHHIHGHGTGIYRSILGKVEQ
jgi:hypothetical protein